MEHAANEEQQRGSRVDVLPKPDDGSQDLSQEEHKRLKNAFDCLDPDKTNRIDVEDLRFLLRCNFHATILSLRTHRDGGGHKEHAGGPES